MASSTDHQRNRLTDLLDRVNRMTRGLQYAQGLNPAQWDALRFVARANKYSRTSGALARFLGTTKGTASQTVNALEKKGLLTRRHDAARQEATVGSERCEEYRRQALDACNADAVMRGEVAEAAVIDR